MSSDDERKTMIRDVPLHSDNIVMIITRASGSGKQLVCADPPFLANLFLANLFVTGGSVEFELARPDLGHRVTPTHSSRNVKVGLGLQCLVANSSFPCSEITHYNAAATVLGGSRPQACSAKMAVDSTSTRYTLVAPFRLEQLSTGPNSSPSSPFSKLSSILFDVAARSDSISINPLLESV
ncbi:hypothetical protein FRC08_015110 [Ceratobasidium sp. 394]|nr:hypothetical protein FRC08_015110 [Ceratobasidium sp. 394]